MLLGSTDKAEEWLLVASDFFYFISLDGETKEMNQLGHLSRANFSVGELEISPFFGGYIFTHEDESVAIASNFVDTPDVVRFLRKILGEPAEIEGFETIRQEIESLKALLKQADFSKVKRENAGISRPQGRSLPHPTNPYSRGCPNLAHRGPRTGA